MVAQYGAEGRERQGERCALRHGHSTGTLRRCCRVRLSRALPLQYSALLAEARLLLSSQLTTYIMECRIASVRIALEVLALH